MTAKHLLDQIERGLDGVTAERLAEMLLTFGEFGSNPGSNYNNAVAAASAVLAALSVEAHPFPAQNYNFPCAHPSQCDNSCFSVSGLERLSIRAGGSENAAYAFTEADDEGDYVTYNDAKRAITAAEARATAAEATITALQEALEAIADEPTLGEPFKSENRIMSRDMMIERTRKALATIRRTK